ncbi:nicotinate-nucleotide adenylyltransferase [uncultured Cocleimonas sp.]|uniref:nicotinate-nucleotide adenylyltransferase n=1 Tax=uncultured Cocleimonas sp. TaxID=1051587 RepID=UPI002603DFD8|nr:nicotinate-nucleotide adenylyltransferase [uncultured Cocleimonas sp.]
MIAIIGGTFDPIHFGHLRPALDIAEKLSLTEVRFIPSATPPHRWQPEASAEDRINMVKLSIEGTKPFILDDREYHREGASYTIDTLKSIRSEIGNDQSFSMILGLDAFQSFTSWKDWKDIVETCHIVIAARPGYQIDATLDEYLAKRVTDNIDDLKSLAAGKIYFCDVTQLDISATMIRDKLKNQQSCDYLTPAKVCDYIESNKLYGSDK